MKLQVLTKKVSADFLSMTKAAIMTQTQMTVIPINIQYIQALAAFQQEVNKKTTFRGIKKRRS